MDGYNPDLFFIEQPCWLAEAEPPRWHLRLPESYKASAREKLLARVDWCAENGVPVVANLSGNMDLPPNVRRIGAAGSGAEAAAAKTENQLNLEAEAGWRDFLESLGDGAGKIRTIELGGAHLYLGSPASSYVQQYRRVVPACIPDVELRRTVHAFLETSSSETDGPGAFFGQGCIIYKAGLLCRDLPQEPEFYLNAEACIGLTLGTEGISGAVSPVRHRNRPDTPGFEFSLLSIESHADRYAIVRARS